MQPLTDARPRSATATATPAGSSHERGALRAAYDATRALSEALTEGLSAEDQALQSMPDASPTKWHLAHTAWFFETLVLRPHAAGYRPFDERYGALFNSYYEALGPRHPRPQRGLLSRPTLAEVWRYREHVDRAMRAFIEGAGAAAFAPAAPLVELGLHHEQQHQELMLTDLKHAFSLNPLAPAWRPRLALARSAAAPPLRWLDFDGGVVEVGHGGPGFAFDNEGPRHALLLQPWRLASRPVSCGEYLEFIRDGGYRCPALWLSDGWAAVQAEGWQAPLHWRAAGDGAFQLFTLHGLRALDLAEPVCHLSHYEAAAYAEWAGARLPTEFEWEAACILAGTSAAADGAPRPMHPLAATETADAAGLQQMQGEVWQWTRSAYAPYPGFRPFGGEAGEYNGKFMINQMVLRGSSCATPPGHARPSYRNFFPPSARWQFSGLRLARDAG